MPLHEYSRANRLTLEVVKAVAQKFLMEQEVKSRSKKEVLEQLENIRIEKEVPNAVLCDAFSEAVYLPRLQKIKDKLPQKFIKDYIDLQ